MTYLPLPYMPASQKRTTPSLGRRCVLRPHPKQVKLRPWTRKTGHGPVSPLAPRQRKVTAARLLTDQRLPEAPCESPHTAPGAVLHPHNLRVNMHLPLCDEVGFVVAGNGGRVPQRPKPVSLRADDAQG